MKTGTTVKSFQLPKMLWLVELGKEKGIYFYLEPIEELRNRGVHLSRSPTLLFGGLLDTYPTFIAYQ